jgi:hypothetical protein
MSGQATTETVEREFKHLFREVPKWIIKKMEVEGKYLIKFPMKTSDTRLLNLRALSLRLLV